jgi:hypothetical protein
MKPGECYRMSVPSRCVSPEIHNIEVRASARRFRTRPRPAGRQLRPRSARGPRPAPPDHRVARPPHRRTADPPTTTAEPLTGTPGPPTRNRRPAEHNRHNLARRTRPAASPITTAGGRAGPADRADLAAPVAGKRRSDSDRRTVSGSRPSDSGRRGRGPQARTSLAGLW